MAARSATYNWDKILTGALWNYWGTGKIADNIFNGLVLVEYMLKQGNVEYKKGGASILVPLAYAKNTTAKSYRGYDVLDVTPQDQITSAEFHWKQYSVSVSVSGLEKAQAGGPHEIFDPLKAQIELAEMSMRDKLNTDMFTDGTGNSSKEITGLKAVAPEDPTTGTYGGINRANEPWWRSITQSANGSFATNGRKKWLQMWKDVSLSRKSGVSSLILTTPNLHGYYELSLNANERFVMESSPRGGDAGFGPLSYKGIPVEYDHAMPQDSGSKEAAYWLNMNNLKIIIHKDKNFKPTPFKTPEDQDASVAQIQSYLEIVCNNSRHQGYSYGWEA